MEEKALKYPIELALLASGGGTTARHIYFESIGGRLKGLVEVRCLIVSKECGAIEKLQSLGLPSDRIFIIRPKDFPNRHRFGQAIARILRKHNIRFYHQVGWMPLTPRVVCEHFVGMNQHPGPVPEFGGKGMMGLAVHEAVVSFRKMIKRPFYTEATAQFVHPQYDRGLVIMRRLVPVYAHDTAEELQARVLPIEHEVQVEAWRRWCKGGFCHLPSFIVRKRVLVRPQEKDLLEQAKQIGRERYPHG